MNKIYTKILLAAFLSFLIIVPTKAQDMHDDSRDIWRAKVINIVSEEERDDEGLNIKVNYQTVEAEILQGPQKGKTIIMENDFLSLEKGDKFFISHLVTEDNEDLYIIQEPDRRGAIYFFVLLFIVVVIYFGGRQGVRSLLALAGSFFIIFQLFLPRLLSGASPTTTSAFFSVLILVFVIYFTHGFNRTSTAALLGTIITVFFTICLAYIAVKVTQISGFIEEETIYLNLDTGGKLDFSGLFLGAIIIGVLGMLDDIAITQASSVKELSITAPNLKRKQIYKKALHIGKEHVGALVNTLALAYVSVSLPLLLFFLGSDSSPFFLVNREIFAAEIIRTIIGSIGIVLTVPISTWFAALMLVKNNVDKGDKVGDNK